MAVTLTRYWKLKSAPNPFGVVTPKYQQWDLVFNYQGTGDASGGGLSYVAAQTNIFRPEDFVLLTQYYMYTSDSNCNGMSMSTRAADWTKLDSSQVITPQHFHFMVTGTNSVPATSNTLLIPTRTARKVEVPFELGNPVQDPIFYVYFDTNTDTKYYYAGLTLRIIRPN